MFWLSLLVSGFALVFMKLGAYSVWMSILSGMQPPEANGGGKNGGSVDASGDIFIDWCLRRAALLDTTNFIPGHSPRKATLGSISKIVLHPPLHRTGKKKPHYQIDSGVSL